MAFNWNPFSRRNVNDVQKGMTTPSVKESLKNNSNFNVFNGVNDDITAIVNSRSVVGQMLAQQSVKTANPVWAIPMGDNILAMPIANDKNQRVSMYKNIASYPVCRWCIDQIAYDFIHEDENHEFIKLTLPDRLNAIQKKVLQREFKKYINLFNLRDNGYSLIRKFIIEGELAWENVINPKYPTLGIIGVKFLPSEYYETLIDTFTNERVGIGFDVEAFAEDKRQLFTNNINTAASVFNMMSSRSYNFHFSKETAVPLLMNQLTYIDSGEYSDDNTVTYSLIESVKQQYHRLALIEDAAIILRVTRAPERLVFNVSTGKMDQNRADEYVRRFATELKSKKVASPGGNDIMGVYNAPSMLKQFVFAKSDGNDGTSVTSVGSTAAYDQMNDIEHFLRAMLKQFNIPWARWKTPENVMEKNDQISQEEYTFSRMIIHMQRRFANGFKRGFITHLKLREIWDQENYELDDSEIQVEFQKPVNYDLYETQKLVEAKMAIYKAFADADEISKISCLKKYLGYTDEDISENFKNLIKEKQMTAIADIYSTMIKEDNLPVDIASPIRLQKDIANAQKNIQGSIENQNTPIENTESSDTSEQTSSDENPSNDENEKQETVEPEPPAEPSFGLG